MNNKLALKLSLSALLGMVVLMMASCTSMLASESNNPKLAWDEFSRFISSNDAKSAYELSANAGCAETVSKSEFTALLQKQIADCYAYKYTAETSVLGVVAWQEMDITFLDMRRLTGEGIDRIVTNAYEHNYKYGSYKSDSEIEAAVTTNINELIISPSDFITTQHMRVEFSYKDGRWKPVIDDELYDVLSGYSRYAEKSINDGIAKLKTKDIFKSEDSEE